LGSEQSALDGQERANCARRITPKHDHNLSHKESLKNRGREETGLAAAKTTGMDASIRETPELEIALLRRGLDDLSAAEERCGRCRRTLLVGEYVHVYDADWVVCDLCRGRERKPPTSVRLVHGPAFGHTIRLIDQPRAA